MKRGEFVSIIGPSGSGKSTLLHVLGLLDEVTRGKVSLDGIDVSKLKERERASIRARKIGFVFQTFNLIPTLTVLENVALPGIICELNEEDVYIRAKEILNIVSMGDRLLHYPNQLSGGQRQRVAIARALINAPEIILADEPTGNLDSKTGNEVLNVFKELNKEGKTVIIITHDLSITTVTDRSIHIKDGKIEGE
ncbi:ABC transporter ATP-binding protein [Candidatus Micrarchaeota archaeon]|nr:ABC transporter ATP-binding protein [Candidatus Micrarchaeota archaeon]